MAPEQMATISAFLAAQYGIVTRLAIVTSGIFFQCFQFLQSQFPVGFPLIIEAI